MAFAVLIKLSGLTGDLEGILQALDYESMNLPEVDGPAKDKLILEALQKDPSFQKVLNHWITASKMKIWLNGKK